MQTRMRGSIRRTLEDPLRSTRSSHRGSYDAAHTRVGKRRTSAALCSKTQVYNANVPWRLEMAPPSCARYGHTVHRLSR